MAVLSCRTTCPADCLLDHCPLDGWMDGWRMVELRMHGMNTAGTGNGNGESRIGEGEKGGQKTMPAMSHVTPSISFGGSCSCSCSCSLLREQYQVFLPPLLSFRIPYPLPSDLPVFEYFSALSCVAGLAVLAPLAPLAVQAGLI